MNCTAAIVLWLSLVLLGSMTFDARGNLTRTDYPDGAFTTSIYDAAGRLVSTQYPDNTTATTAYDALGRRTSSIDQNWGVELGGSGVSERIKWFF